jgi:GIY-YIG catalytic domain
MPERSSRPALAGPLGLVTDAPKHLDSASEERLSARMREHLQVAVHPFPERDAVADLEQHVLAQLNPPLNLDGMPPTTLRETLSKRRR